MNKSSLCLASIALCGALSAQTTYYSDAVNGNDATNSGLLPSAAFKSMTKASSVMAAGDTLVVLPGVYDISIEGSFPVQFGNTATSQDNILVIGIEGPAVTIVDGGGTYDGIGMIRFHENAKGARLTGFGFRNMADSFWSCAIRLGSASGGAFRAVDVEVDNCIFESSLSRAFVIFGSSTTTQATTEGCRIHNNLMLGLNPNRRTCAVYGSGANHLYNNTILHATDTTDRAAIYLNSLAGTPSSNAVVRNNIIIGGGTSSWGIEKGPVDVNFSGGATAVVENNNSFGNLTNYVNFTPGGTNLSVDPEFVSATDLRLKSTSKMIDAGTNNVAVLRHDLDYSPAAFAAGTSGRITDIGAYEFHTNDFTVTAPPVLGGNAAFAFTGTGGIAGLLLGFNEISFLAPFGVVLADTLFLVTTTSSPGTVQIPVPNLPGAEGLRVVFQGIYSGANGLEMLNVDHSYVRK